MRRARGAYRRRRDQLVSRLRQQVPGIRISGIAAGLHIVVALPAGMREDDLVTRGARRGLAVEGLACYGVAGHKHSPALVIGYATPPSHAFTAAVDLLCGLLSGD